METKCASEMKNYMKFKVKKNAKLLCKLLMITFDDSANENKIEHNPKWPYIPDHPYRILIVGGSGSRKNKCIIKFNK